MKVRLTQEAKKYITVAEMPAVRRIIADMIPVLLKIMRRWQLMRHMMAELITLESLKLQRRLLKIKESTMPMVKTVIA